MAEIDNPVDVVQEKIKLIQFLTKPKVNKVESFGKKTARPYVATASLKSSMRKAGSHVDGCFQESFEAISFISDFPNKCSAKSIALPLHHRRSATVIATTALLNNPAAQRLRIKETVVQRLSLLHQPPLVDIAARHGATAVQGRGVRPHQARFGRFGSINEITLQRDDRYVTNERSSVAVFGGSKERPKNQHYRLMRSVRRIGDRRNASAENDGISVQGKVATESRAGVR